MGQGTTRFLALLAAFLIGCNTDQPLRSTSLFNRLHLLKPPEGSNVVQVDVAIIERPLDDPFLANELWTFADEQIIPLERKAVLDQNGFRIGQIGGIKPSGLQKLLISERTCICTRRY